MKVNAVIRKLSDEKSAAFNRTHVVFVKKAKHTYSILVNDDAIEGNPPTNTNLNTVEADFAKLNIINDARSKTKTNTGSFISGSFEDLVRLQDLVPTYTTNHSSLQG
jgi:hypothetical protein